MLNIHLKWYKIGLLFTVFPIWLEKKKKKKRIVRRLRSVVTEEISVHSRETKQERQTMMKLS